MSIYVFEEISTKSDEGYLEAADLGNSIDKSKSLG